MKKGIIINAATKHKMCKNKNNVDCLNCSDCKKLKKIGLEKTYAIGKTDEGVVAFDVRPGQ